MYRISHIEYQKMKAILNDSFKCKETANENDTIVQKSIFKK